MLLLLHRVKPSLANQFDQKWVNHDGVTHNLELIFLFPSLFLLTAPVNYFFLSLFNMGFGPSGFLKKAHKAASFGLWMCSITFIVHDGQFRLPPLGS